MMLSYFLVAILLLFDVGLSWFGFGDTTLKIPKDTMLNIRRLIQRDRSYQTGPRYYDDNTIKSCNKITKSDFKSGNRCTFAHYKTGSNIIIRFSDKILSSNEKRFAFGDDGNDYVIELYNDNEYYGYDYKKEFHWSSLVQMNQPMLGTNNIVYCEDDLINNSPIIITEYVGDDIITKLDNTQLKSITSSAFQITCLYMYDIINAMLLLSNLECSEGKTVSYRAWNLNNIISKKDGIGFYLNKYADMIEYDSDTLYDTESIIPNGTYWNKYGLNTTLYAETMDIFGMVSPLYLFICMK